MNPLLICDKCGKEMPQTVDEDKSTAEWTVYKLVWDCECGGEFKYKGEKDAK